MSPKAWPFAVVAVAGIVAAAVGSLWALVLVTFATALWSLMYSQTALSRRLTGVRANDAQTIVSVFALRLKPEAWEALGFTPEEREKVTTAATFPIGCRIETWGPGAQKVVRFRLRVMRQGMFHEEIRDAYDDFWLTVPIWTFRLGDDDDSPEVRFEWFGGWLSFYVWGGRFGGKRGHDGSIRADAQHTLFVSPLPLWLPNPVFDESRELEKYRLRPDLNGEMGQFVHSDKNRGFGWNLTVLRVTPHSLAVVRSTRAGIVRARLYSGGSVFFPMSFTSSLLDIEERRIPKRGELCALTFAGKSLRVESAFLWGRDDDAPHGAYRDTGYGFGPIYRPDPARVPPS